MLDFCLRIWMYLIAIGTVIVLVRAVCTWKTSGHLEKWAMASFLVFALHILEESKIPGGYWFLVNNANPSYPVNAVSYMAVNVLVLVLAIGVIMRGLGTIPAMAFMLFTAKETILHCVVFVRDSLSLCGFFYAPGFITALFGFMPLSMVLLVKVIERRPGFREFLLGLAVSALVITLLYFLEMQFLTAFSSYAFSDPGFYSALS